MSLKNSTPGEVKFRAELAASRGELIEILLGYVSDTFGPEIVEDAWNEFHGWKNDSGFDPENPIMQLFMPWFFYDWMIDNGIYPNAPEDSTLAQMILTSSSVQLEDLQREYIEVCVKQGMSFFEVVELWRGTGFKLVDVLTGETHDAHEKMGSLNIPLGALIFGKLVTIRGLTAFESMSPIMIPAEAKADILHLRDEMIAQSGTITSSVLRDWDSEILGFFLAYEAELTGRNAELPDASPETDASIDAIVRSHWMNWLEKKSPVLDDLSPLEAIELQGGREAVAEMLSEIEAEASKGMHPGAGPALFKELRELLGLSKHDMH